MPVLGASRYHARSPTHVHLRFFAHGGAPTPYDPRLPSILIPHHVTTNPILRTRPPYPEGGLPPAPQVVIFCRDRRGQFQLHKGDLQESTVASSAVPPRSAAEAERFPRKGAVQEVVTIVRPPA